MGPRGWDEETVWPRRQGLKGPQNERPTFLQTQPRPHLFLHRLSLEILLFSPTRTKSTPYSPSTDCFLLRVTATLHGLYRPEKSSLFLLLLLRPSFDCLSLLVSLTHALAPTALPELGQQPQQPCPPCGVPQLLT